MFVWLILYLVILIGYYELHALLIFDTYLAHGLVSYIDLLRLISVPLLELTYVFLFGMCCASHRPLPKTFFLFIFTAFLAIHGIQFTSLLYSSEYIRAELIPFAPIATHVISMSKLLYAFFLYLAVIALYWRSLRPPTRKKPFSEGAICSVFVVIVAILSYQKTDLALAHPLPPQLSSLAPTQDFFVELTRYISNKNNPQIKLSSKSANFLAQHRIKANITAQHPLYRDSVDGNDSTRIRRSEKGIGVDKPNVIIFFIESFSAAFLSPYLKDSRKDLTPSISDFASTSLVVEDYVNHTTPTVLGIAGQLCSYYPSFSHADWQRQHRTVPAYPIQCLSHYFHQAEYETLFIGSFKKNNHFYNTYLNELQFNNLFFATDIARSYNRSTKPYAIDEKMYFQFIVDYLKGREESDPFFLTGATFKTHVGLKCKEKYLSGENGVLNCFHTFDQAFKVFWDYFKNSSYANDTIVILTGDHAIYPNDETRSAAPDWYLDNRFGYLGLMIHSELHNLPRRLSAQSTSIDLAPTVLHLLDVTEFPNSFVGRSLFEVNKTQQKGLGFIYGRNLLKWSETGTPIIQPQAKCAVRQDCHEFQALRWLEQLHAANRMAPQPIPE